jgi:hypothetical protein
VNAPRILRSVVIASHNGPIALQECLNALAPSLGADSELIVSASFREGEADALRSWASERELQAILVEAPEAQDVPHLRVAGLRAAKGDLVLLTEDHLSPLPEWLDAPDSDDAVTTGAIAFPGGSAFERAAYLFEYGSFMPPLGEGQWPSGANVAYSRDALSQLEAFFDEYEWEHAWNEHLAQAGCRFSASDAMQVSWCHRGARAKFRATARLHGRNYGARRHFASEGRKAIQLMLLPVMPFVLAGSKLAAAIAKQPASFLSWLAAGPALISLYVAWCVGEAQGYITGETSSDIGWRS